MMRLKQEDEEQAVSDVENGEEVEDGDVTDTTDEADETEGSDEDEDQDDKDEDGEHDTETNDDTTSNADTVKIGDKTYTHDELEKGFMRQNDYTKKTQSLAEERKSFDEEVKNKKQEIANVFEQKKQYLESLEQQVLPDYMQITEQELDELIEVDPTEFARVDAKRRRFSEKQMVKQREYEAGQQELSRQQQEYNKSEIQRFFNMIPSEKANPEYMNKIAEHAIQKGVPKELMNSIADAGIFNAFADSYELSELKKSTLNVAKNKVVKKPIIKKTNTNTVTKSKTTAAAEAFNESPTWQNLREKYNFK